LWTKTHWVPQRVTEVRSRSTEPLPQKNWAETKYNAVAAQMSRGKSEKILAFAMSSVAATLAKFSMDVCLYMSQNFDFITLPAHLTTGSSIMPHKKNRMF
jgi:argininosuccinate lyase